MKHFKHPCARRTCEGAQERRAAFLDTRLTRTTPYVLVGIMALYRACDTFTSLHSLSSYNCKHYLAAWQIQHSRLRRSFARRFHQTVT